jgi:hypothetical protein
MMLPPETEIDLAVASTHSRAVIPLGQPWACWGSSHCSALPLLRAGVFGLMARIGEIA